ncbi:transporter [Acidobacterium sp. S8]|uniref:transporter n=1 Tax=Acidobacterium sp. S8 TaxID=1641854 RepID=UPI001C20834B|nr:transporter [Acidobacterium sp. S8]
MLTIFTASERVWAQDLEPRAYAASPVGITFLGVVMARSSGDVTFDPSIPITNVSAKLYLPVATASHTFALFHRQTLFSAGLPYVWGNVTGDVGTQSGKVYRSGLGDLRLRYSVNLHGSPAMSAKEFARKRHGYILGTSLTVQAPSGQYGATKLINIGTNRWSIKPEIGFSYPVRKVDLDFYAGTWFFTDNSSYYPGNVNRTQQPVTALQAHVSYTIRRGLWAAFDSTWYNGGDVSMNNGPYKNRENNSRLGGTVSIPLPASQSIKVAYSEGVYGTIGADFTTWTIGWQKTIFR